MTGVELFVSELQARGVTWISTVCGHGLNPFDAACHKAGVRLIDTRNEQTAGYMAECWGRLSRTVGVCAVSSGVAHANAMTGVVNAYFDGAPMLLISGAGANATSGMGHFQDLDQVALAAPVCKYAKVIDVPERVPQFVEEAFTEALTGRPGPVHLTFPLDVQAAEVDETKVLRREAGLRTSTCSPTGVDAQLVREAAQLLERSERPLLVAGSGVYYSNGERALAELAGALSIPIVVPIWDRGPVVDPIPQFMGVLGAASGGPELLSEADLILMLGAMDDYRVGYLQPPAVSNECKVIRVDSDARRLHAGVAANLSVPSDPRSFLESLTQVCLEGNLSATAEWLAISQQRRDEYRAQIAASAKCDGGLHAVDIVDALKETATEDTIFVVDGGSIGQWFHQLACDRYPSHYLTCGASGVVGYGIAGAMAATAGFPERPVILLSGDGSMTFTIADLECAARQRLPFVVIVADDESWGIAETGQVKELGQAISSKLGPLQFDVVAQGLGCNGFRILHPHDIAPAMTEGLAADRPTLIHVPIVGGFPGD